jgi:hypothetical protein
MDCGEHDRLWYYAALAAAMDTDIKNDEFSHLQHRSLFSCAVEVLRTSCAHAKASKTKRFAAAWFSQELHHIILPTDNVTVPDAPARPDYVRIVSKHEKMKQGNRKAFVHRYPILYIYMSVVYEDET